jgi:hypothetical protein
MLGPGCRGARPHVPALLWVNGTTAVYAQDQLEHAVRDMRGQFRAVSSQIADELGRLTQHVAASPPAVRERVITAAAQIASTQQFLRAESDRLPPDPQEAYVIMESVLQAQQGALHQLAIIVKQHAPGWYPNLSAWQQPALADAAGGWPASVPTATAWPPSQPPPAVDQNGGMWPPAQPTLPGEEASVQPGSWYPSPPTVQELASHGWAQAHQNGQGAGVQSAARALVPYVSNGYLAEPAVQAPFPGRRSYSLFPAPYQSYVQPDFSRGYAAPTRQPTPGQLVAAARKRAEPLNQGPSTRHLFWLGIGAALLIFAYATFPWELRRLDAVADQKMAAQEVEPQPPPRLEPRPRVMQVPTAAPVPTVIARAPEPAEEPPQSSAASRSGMILPGGLVVGSPNMAVGGAWPPQPSAPPVTRAPPPETLAAAPVEPAPRTKQRAAPSRVDQEIAAAEAAARGERFVPVLFTDQDQMAAAQAFGDLQNQFPQVLAGKKAQTQAVDLGKKGTWHRLVLLPAGSRQDADNVCSQLMASGYEKCWVKPY